MILAAYKYWGEQCVSRLRGMFAFLIWDNQERVLFGARDWFGIKPLYTMTDSRGTFFGSEKKSLLALAQGRRQRRRAGHPVAAALPDPAVRPRAGQHARRHHPDRERHRVPAAARRPVETWRYFEPTFPIGRVDDAERLYRQVREVMRGLGRQAHARRRDGRRVPVRRHRLDRDRGAGQAAQPAT